MFGRARGWHGAQDGRNRMAGTGALAGRSHRRAWLLEMDHEVENMQPRDDDALLTPSEVAAMFRVNPKTVTRWARAGKISAIRTLGGHRRFRASEIRQFLEQVEQTDRF